MIVRRIQDNWLHERAHTKSIAELCQSRKYRFLVIKPLRIATITINGYVFAEMGCHIWKW